MKTHQLLFLFAWNLMFFSCQESSPKQISSQQDYQQFLDIDNSERKENQLSNLKFWVDKYQKQPNQYPYLTKIAAANTALFQTTGDVNYLLKAEHQLKQQIKFQKGASNLRILAKNYVSQHRFQEALHLLLEAYEIGEKRMQTAKMLFDVYLEIGAYQKAERYLDDIKQTNDFDYLIRAGKWNDVHGNLETAISFLERALEVAKSRNDASLLIWSYSNLADFYGHHNDLETSYSYYLKTLELDPSNAYAKKGIAWIVYSHEKNSQEASRILNSIQEYHQSPDYYLFKAELAEYNHQEHIKEQNLALFLSSVSKKSYGKMYDQHASKLYLDEYEEIQTASALIKEEIENRPTPGTYDLLAWSYYKIGDHQEALRIAKEFVVGKSHEPEVIFHLAKIYKANGMTQETQKLKRELLESAFEIGPVALSQVQKI